VVEKYPDGKPQVRYRTDEQGRKDGPYEEFGPEGKPRVRGTYAAGLKSGNWTTYRDGGKVVETANYRKGLLEGAYSWAAPDGSASVRGSCRLGGYIGAVTVLDAKGRMARQPVYPRALGEVKEACNTLYPKELQPTKFSQDPVLVPPYSAGAVSPQALEEALKVAKLYRYLSGLPWQHLALDAKAVAKAQHGTVVLNKIGSLTHEPSKPADMSDAFFALAHPGCKESNIHRGQDNLVEAIRGWMDDSDASNIGRVGHRRWILKPGLQKVGFGFANGFATMHVVDGSQKVPPFEYFAFPGEGYYPVQLVGPHYAWSLHLNSTKVQPPQAGSLVVKLAKLDEHFQATEQVPSPVVSVIEDDRKGCHSIVFKPELKSLEAGKYWVEVAGLKGVNGKPRALAYVVDLVDVPEAGAVTRKERREAR
jgi:hypothetical protein